MSWFLPSHLHYIINRITKNTFTHVTSHGNCNTSLPFPAIVNQVAIPVGNGPSEHRFRPDNNQESFTSNQVTCLWTIANIDCNGPCHLLYCIFLGCTRRGVKELPGEVFLCEKNSSVDSCGCALKHSYHISFFGDTFLWHVCVFWCISEEPSMKTVNSGGHPLPCGWEMGLVRVQYSRCSREGVG